MTKNILKLAAVPSVFGLVSMSLSVKDSGDFKEYSTDGLDLSYTVPVEDDVEPHDLDVTNFANVGTSFAGFKEALGFKESRNDYSRINKFGYLGRYQFGRSTLLLLGINDTEDFINNPVLQDKAFIANLARNKWVLRKDIKRFAGKEVNGVLVTESGILAAAHLGGPGSVKRYLRSGGVDGFRDAFGTSLKSYMKKFGGYDTSFIEADHYPKVEI
ncbi:hypothetical protein [Flavimarina sp. Hel_I_48]|uniref:hypothetical protein n=1 Tax=Flavimarina sp. Hel_I_48 TaxID=1392488 RepID=UPI0004DEDD87|nr:hypothetical protein [Flavimarina sp. Hel_I_48]